MGNILELFFIGLTHKHDIIFFFVKHVKIILLINFYFISFADVMEQNAADAVKE